MTHRLTELFAAAADGVLPPADGVVEVVGAPPGRVDAVVAFTGHSVVATGLPRPVVDLLLDPTDLGSALNAGTVAALAELLDTTPGSLDVVLTAPIEIDGDAPRLREVDGGANPRVERARRYRDQVRVWTDAQERAALVLGRGLAGRMEVSLEVEPAHRGQGLGRRLLSAVRTLVGAEPVFAQVAPGNAASLRAFVAAGFTPLGAEVLFPRER